MHCYPWHYSKSVRKFLNILHINHYTSFVLTISYWALIRPEREGGPGPGDEPIARGANAQPYYCFYTKKVSV